MTRKLALTCLALGAALALVVTAALAGTTARRRRSRCHARRRSCSAGTSPLSGPASAYASVARGADAYFKYVEREGRGARTQDHLQVRRRRLQPGAERPGDAAARRAGQGVRGLQLARHRAEPRGARLPERREGAAAVRRLRRYDLGPRLRAVPVHDRLPAELPGRGMGLRQVPGANGRRARRSPSSSRTTTTARICSPGSSAASSGRR